MLPAANAEPTPEPVGPTNADGAAAAATAPASAAAAAAAAEAAAAAAATEAAPAAAVAELAGARIAIGGPMQSFMLERLVLLARRKGDLPNAPSQTLHTPHVLVMRSLLAVSLSSVRTRSYGMASSTRQQLHIYDRKR